SDVRDAADGFAAETVPGRNKYIWLGSDKGFDAVNLLFNQTEHGWIWAPAYGIHAESSTFIVERGPETWRGLGFEQMSTSEALPVLEGLFRERLGGQRLIGELGDGST